MTKKITTTIIIFFINFISFAQHAPFTIYIEPTTIKGLGGLQSFAFGQYNGTWLLLGGRLDGLHRKQPFAAFDRPGANKQLMVIDPVKKQKWAVPLVSLPKSIREQLSSSNMQFFQQGDYLYCVGGYGYSATADEHITYGKLTAIKISAVIKAIVKGTRFTAFFRQITDTAFAVTGGKLLKINDTYHLVGGQKFTGRYNPIGPNHGPGFEQQYTNAIRRFTLSDNGTAITINNLPAYNDSVNLHRRDNNVVPQIMPNGAEGFTSFSGVFQQSADLPFLTCVNVDSIGYSVGSSFQQYYNHYHCANMPLYAASANQMHNIFFGGIAQYYDSLGTLVQDNNVPFTKTISRVTRNANGEMAEYKLPVKMPTLLGAGSEFIPASNIPQYANNVFKLDDFNADSTLVGYIYGGIKSSAKNIFWINEGEESRASSRIFKVYVIKNKAGSKDQLNEQSTGTLQMQVTTNPDEGDFIVKFNLIKKVPVRLLLFNAKGGIVGDNTNGSKQNVVGEEHQPRWNIVGDNINNGGNDGKMEDKILDNVMVGENIYQRKIPHLDKGGAFMLTIETPNEKATQKIIVAP